MKSLHDLQVRGPINAFSENMVCSLSTYWARLALVVTILSLGKTLNAAILQNAMVHLIINTIYRCLFSNIIS